MSAGRDSKTQRETPSPISLFAAAFEVRFPGAIDPWRALAQLGVPPDLRYLNDGLARSAAVIRACSEELDELLSRNAAESPLSSAALLEGIESMKVLAVERDWSGNGSALLEMARESNADHHPLRNYCLNTLNHWALLFYSTPPTLVQQLSIPNSIEAACEEFFSYLLAAQALVPVTRYQDFMERWWTQKKLPGISLIPDSAMDSRLGNATLAMRRLSTDDSLPLLAALTDESHSTFCERLAAAQTMPDLSEKNGKGVNDLALLVECLNPYWRSPGKRRRGLTGRRRQTTHHLEDGYIRVSERTVAQEIDTESGLTVTAYSLETEKCAADDGEDGMDVLPMADRVSGESISTATLAVDDGSYARVSAHPIQSRWVADQIRRDSFSHALTAHRVLGDDIDSIFMAMQTVPDDPELREMLVRLHASMASSTALKKTSHIILSDSRLSTDPTERTVVYRRDTQMWEIRVYPPAYSDAEVTSIERPVGQWLRLPDATGFGDMLKRYGFWNRDALPDLKLGRNILRKLTAWIAEATGDTHATIAGCSHFLFHRILSVTRGDLGAALILTGRSHSHGSSVIHYSHYRESMLVDTYRNAFCNQLSTHATGNESRADGDALVQGFGARRVPTLQAVFALTSGLKEGIIDARKGNDHVRWHNLYTAYTLVGFVLGLALRAISDPHLIDLSAMLATFADKARNDYHRRVVAWAALLVEHAKHYAEFRSIVRARAGEEALPAEIAFAYQDPVTGRYEPFRPKHFQMVVGEMFPLEMYALRRYVRTTLLENDQVNAEDIDAWMGHWFTGVGPHDKRSAYPVMRLVEMANGPVTELLRATGFEPMRAIA